MDTADSPTVNEEEKQINNSPDKTDKPWLFQKGQSGNPNGRPPKGYSISDAVKKMLSEKPERKAIIIEKIMNAAEAGDIVATKLIWNYMDGMPTQQIENTGEVQLNVNGLLAKAYGTTEPDSTT